MIKENKYKDGYILTYYTQKLGESSPKAEKESLLMEHYNRMCTFSRFMSSLGLRKAKKKKKKKKMSTTLYTVLCSTTIAVFLISWRVLNFGLCSTACREITRDIVVFLINSCVLIFALECWQSNILGFSDEGGGGCGGRGLEMKIAEY